MRTTKFRAKSKSTQKWVYGYIREIWASNQENVRYIICPSVSFENDGWTDSEETEVIPETVGQFTGLTDKNGGEIYENDIVKPNIKYITRNCQVVFDSLCYKLATKEWTNWFSELVWSDLEVIGNIHDDPELLQ